MVQVNFRFRAEDLYDRVWSFGNGEGTTYAPYFCLRPNGKIAGYRHENECFWDVRDGHVVLLDELEVPTTVFDQVEIDEDGRFTLIGRFRDGAIIHVLREIPPPDSPNSLPAHELIQRRPANRRNLVILRANEESLHRSWDRDLADEHRSWDLCVSFYGRDENFPLDDFSEYTILQNDGKKFPSLKQLLQPDSPFWRYEYFLFPDDDIQMRWSDINTMFGVCREFNLDIAQPSLHPSGVINWPATRQKPEYVLRFVSIVEAMIPLMSRTALRACVHTFGLSQSGWGVDYIWSRVVGGPMTRIAVIDKVAVVHTRPTGTNYDFEAARREGRAVSYIYGLTEIGLCREYGGILAKP